jgi:dTDP-D-glucose 4,6-dehydratase
MKTESQMNLTPAEQKYAYMYVKDFASIIHKMSISPIKSGIYNVSSKHDISIRTLVEKLRDKVNPSFKLNFGVMEYRPNQSMHIAGSIDKLTKAIGEIKFTDFDLALNQTIKHYNN